MGVRSRASELWSQEQQSWIEKPWTWKLLAFLALPLLISAATSADDSPWLAAMSLLLAVIDVTLAGLAYRAARRASPTGSRGANDGN